MQPNSNNTQEQQPQKDKTKYFSVKAKSILEKEISINELAEPYIIIESRK